jgi:hypothetical protein
LAANLKDLAERAFGYSPKHIGKTAFLFDNLNIINHPWDKDKMCAGKDWF